ncbi:MAG: esterase-like activity of phytase family protein [Bdellovibrionaceae bacterium]|nr:esterase-like activity of phytase family protein [Pseudobdellovibrionaceae bacterium]
MFYRILLFVSALTGCSYLQKSSIPISLKFVNEQVLEKETVFKGLKVGGLSELAFDQKTAHLIALSDDKKKHRWYELSLQKKPKYHIKIVKQIFLKSPNSKKLNQNMDPEAIVFYGDKDVFIASEGQQIYKEHEPTQIFTFNREGFLKDKWPVNPVFWQATPENKAGKIGTQENKGFESLSLDKKKQTLWTATEKPLKQDLIFKNKSLVRLTVFDIKSKKMLSQYPYFLKDTKDGGLTALKFLKNKTFISLERAYKKNKKQGVNEVQLFFTDCRKAKDIKKYITLKKKKIKACSKKLLWSSSQIKNIKVDNLEGLALIPHKFLKNQNLDIKSNKLKNKKSTKKQTLILVSDDNFNPKTQKTQFLFFDLVEK